MTDHDLDAGLQNTMSGVLITRALRERRDALDRVAELEAEIVRLREAARPILDRCLDFFGADDLDPESSEAMPVVIKNRWVYALRAALKKKP